MSITVRYPFRPARPSVHAALVANLFGIADIAGSHVVAEEVEIPVAAGAVIAFTGPSGSGKSSLLRELARERERLGERIVRADALTLPSTSVIDALPLPFDEAIGVLSRCGLAEPRLMLRTPAELSDGERWRFRLALAIAQNPAWIVLDGFTAPLDRTLAKIVAFNVQRQCTRTGIGFLIATCHTDILEDLAPNVSVSCGYGDVDMTTGKPGPFGNSVGTDTLGWRGLRAHARWPRTVSVESRTQCIRGRTLRGHALRDLGPATRQPLSSCGLSFAHELTVAVGSLADWPQFARWHYRSHRVGPVRFVTVLRHNEEPIGICVFTTPPLSLAGRNRFFGRRGKWTRLTVNAVNQQLAMLSRVVLHPTYRGAGLAAAFVRHSCRMCPYPWTESLAQMGHVNPFFEKAGFVRVDVPRRARRVRDQASTLYGVPLRRGAGKCRSTLVKQKDHSKTNVVDPVYYVFDNRANVCDALAGSRALSRTRN